MDGYAVDLAAIDPAQVDRVGGKAAHLAALARLPDVRVPPGFCVTTAAFERILPAIAPHLDRLAGLAPDDRAAIRAAGDALRALVEAMPVPDDVAGAIAAAVRALGEGVACAVRSSATAEDAPTSSFAGQQDTWLNVVGPEAIVDRVRRCWASLFSERAIAYRLHRGLDPRGIRMAVVVQRMVDADASGVLFTADPVTGNRRVASVEAVFGLGEALVAGTVRADAWKVRDGAVIDRAIASKRIALRAAADGGTRPEDLPPALREAPALTDEEVECLVGLGRRIEAAFGRPQDVEWCLADGAFHFVQSRPITTLFPVPDAGDDANRVYVSVGHQQMMTDPMKPLGISLYQLVAGRPMYEAAGRLFVDVTAQLASPATREAVVAALGRSDPLIGDALRQVLDRGFVPLAEGAGPAAPPAGSPPAPPDPDPAVVEALVERTRASVEALRRTIAAQSGVALFDCIRDDVQELKRLLFDPDAHRVFLAAIDAAAWLNEHLEAWLGEKNVADELTKSVPHNVTSEMGLSLLDVADAIRPHPEVVAFLERTDDDGFLDELPRLPGGAAARDAIRGWLDRHGMRCVGEIDVTRPRWSERPTTLLPLLLGNVRRFEAGAGRRRFEQGLREARAKEAEVLERLRALPDGERKAEEAKRRIDTLRAFIGFREHPKYGMVCRLFVYKQALLREIARLVEAGALREAEDAWFLTFDELREAVRTGRADEGAIRRRREAFHAYEALTPPRVLTSEGEAIAGAYRRADLPPGALPGLAVSAGTAEGRARVVLDLEDAALEPGDILVTAFTDPSWTPVFVGIRGLVTEVGGLMTHGAVIAREYGLPAVVGVEDATRRIRDGQRIRVHGTAGYVELLG